MTAAPGTAQAQAPRSQGRSSARLACVQALYQIEMSGQSADEVIEEFLSHRAGHEIDGERYAAPPPPPFRAHRAGGCVAGR